MSWAQKSDLCIRYGQEYVDKLSIRKYFDCDLNTYVADESPKKMNLVVDTALEDSKAWLLWKLSCVYSISLLNSYLDQGKEFPVLKSFHIKLAILFLKHGGDCEECAACKDEFISFCNSNQLCSTDNFCIDKNPTISVTDYKSCLPTHICCDGCGCR